MSKQETTKLWTIKDLAAYLCLADTSEAWTTVREHGIPFVWYGRGEPDLTRRGAKQARFSPIAIQKWTEAKNQVWNDPQTHAAPEAEPTSSGPRGEDWRRELGGPPKRRKPR